MRFFKWLFLIASASLLISSCETTVQATGNKPAAGKTAAAPALQEKPVERVPAATQTAAAAETPDPYANATNLALGKRALANNHIYEFTAPKAVDGDVLTYWEGAAKEYPNEISVDLGEPKSIAAMRLKLNPKRIWQARVQKIAVLISPDGKEFTEALPAAEYRFDPDGNKNIVTIPLAATARSVKLVCTANDGATGGQIAEWEIFGQ